MSIEEAGAAFGEPATEPASDQAIDVSRRLEADLRRRFRAQPALFSEFQDSMLDGIWYSVPGVENEEWLSPQFWKTLGYDPEEMLRRPGAWRDIIDQDDFAATVENAQRHISDPNVPFDQIIRYRRADGDIAWIRCRGFAIRDENGAPERMLGTFTDVTQLMGMQSKLSEARESQSRAEQRLWSAIAAIPDALAIYDPDDKLVICNDQYKRLYSESAHAMNSGASFEEILRAGLENGQYPEAVGREEAWLAERLDRHRNPQGPIEQEIPGDRHLQIHEVRTPTGDTVGLRVEITELRRRQRQLEEYAEALKMAAAELEQQAQEDILTGLANRRRLESLVPKRFPTWTRDYQGVALLLIDLDLFKSVNDTLGHAAGDHVLTRVARILTEETRDSDIVARIGGDEFLIVTPFGGEIAKLEAMSRRLIERISAPIAYGDDMIQIGASIGLTATDCENEEFSRLMSKADSALYKAKAAGRNCVVAA